MPIRSITAITLGLACGTAAAQSESYDFSGTFGNFFAPFFDEAEINSGQSGGVLRFDTGGVVVTTDPADAYTSTTFTPGYNQDWNASIEFDLPLLYDSNYTPSATQFQEITLGIAAAFTDGGTAFNVFGPALEVYNPGTDFGTPSRGYYCDVVTNDVGGDENFIDAPGVATGTLHIAFDATTKVLTATTGDGTVILAADIDAPGSDWGMQDGDTFEIALFGAAQRRAIDASDPVTLDNFEADVTGPDHYYGFDGTLGTEFAPFFDEPGVISAQANSSLEFHTGGVQIADATDAYAHLAFAPTAAESWRASIDVSFPLEYDTFTPVVGVDQWIGAGLAAIFDDGINPFSTAETTLEVWHGEGPEDIPGRFLLSDSQYQGNDAFGNAIDASGIDTATLILEYDAATRTVTSSADGQIIGTIDIAEPGNDWGMADTDTFGIGLFSGATNRSISAASPIAFDNFRAVSLGVPEPTCDADVNGDNVLDNGDIFSFVQLFIAGDIGADFNADGVLDNGDVGAFVAAFLAGCA